jgi:hypothetical protein
MSTIVTNDVSLDINLVDAELNFENLICFDNMSILWDGGIDIGTECGVDKTLKYNGQEIALGDLMDGHYIRVRVDRPNEFQNHCYNFVFEFSYTDISGNTCSYFGDLVLAFPSIINDNYVCGSIDYAGKETCEFPDLLISPLEQVENFQNAFQGTYTGICGHEFPMLSPEIYPNGEEICFIVPPGGCTEIEMTDCPNGNTNQCITAADLVELRKLVLGITAQTPNPFGGLLSDVNNSGSISTLDLVHIQRHILGIDFPGSRIGDCVIFDPNSEGLADEDLEGLGGWSNFDYSVEICDGEDFEIVLGVIGDVNGDCPCDIIDGVSPDDKDEDVQITLNQSKTALIAPSLSFYDLALEIEGQISNISVSENVSPNTRIEVLQKENGAIVFINSLNSTPISLQQCLSKIIWECSGPINFTSKSIILDDNLKQRGIIQGSNTLEPRVSNKLQQVSKWQVNLANNQVFINQNEDESTDLRLYTSEGKLVFSQKSELGNSFIDLTSGLKNFTHGHLFFVVATKNGEIKVEKLLW